MNIRELKAACELTIAGGAEMIPLLIPKGTRYTGKGWPRGRLVNVNERNGDRVVMFKAAALLKMANAAIKQEAKP